MDQCGGMENKEKVPSSDQKEDENENEGLRMMMLFVILNLKTIINDKVLRELMLFVIMYLNKLW